MKQTTTEMIHTPTDFPAGFQWGFAAAAPQIEGAGNLDGKGESIWDRFAKQPGAIHNGDTLDTACDHYHLFDTDFAIMASLGVRNYRLSIAWPRILPDGDGEVNERGIDFYHRLFDSMERHGITPLVTMFHWDLPQALEDRFGGWRDRRIVDAFARYAEVIVKAYGKRVKNWFTLNEIMCFTRLSYGTGAKAPGLKLSEKEVNQTYHHALLCHGVGVRAIREHGSSDCLVGLADNPTVSIPAIEIPEHISAAQSLFHSDNWRILDAIYRGSYSEDYLRACGEDRPEFMPGDFDLISLPTDFLGLNVYTANIVRAGADGTPEVLPLPPNYPVADASWLKITPQAIHWATRLAHDCFGVKQIFITENGCGYRDTPDIHGEIHDLHRRELLRAYLRELKRAIDLGVPVGGYFLWSYLDNFEWEDGYDMRFGAVYCDFKTQKRTPKLSANWYSEVVRSNRIV